jgi:hypothetical protein
MDIPMLINMAVSACVFGIPILVMVGGIYGLFVWYPNYRRKNMENLKATGRQGEATILRVQNRLSNPSRRSLYTMLTIGLEIRVVGLDPYEVDKLFTFHAKDLDKLEEGKVVPVWVDPKAPRNLDKIVIDLK